MCRQSASDVPGDVTGTPETERALAGVLVAIADGDVTPFRPTQPDRLAIELGSPAQRFPTTVRSLLEW